MSMRSAGPVLAAGCTRGGDSGSGDDGATVASAPTTSAADDGAPADGAGAAGGEASSGGDIACILGNDPNLFELEFRHDGAAANYGIEVQFLAGDEVRFDDFELINAVQPGEQVREGFGRTDVTDTSVTRCQVSEVSATPTPEELGRTDVSACQNLRPGEFGGYAYELTFTNSSTTVPAQYAAIVVVRNPAGERRASRLATGRPRARSTPTSASPPARPN